MTALLQQLEELEQRARALASWRRGPAAEAAELAASDFAALRAYTRDPASARALCVAIAAFACLAEAEAKPKRSPPKSAFRSAFTDDQVSEAVRKTHTLAKAGALLGLSESAVSRRYARIRKLHGSRASRQTGAA